MISTQEHPAQQAVQAPLAIPWETMAKQAYDENGQPTWLDDDNQIIPGVYIGMSNEDYHACAAFGSTMIKDVCKKSLKEVHHDHFGDKQFQQSAAMYKGELVHEACLEPDLFDATRFRLVDNTDFPDAIDQIKDLKILLKAHDQPVTGTKKELIARIKSIGQQDHLLETQLTQAYLAGAGQEAVTLAQTHIEAGRAKHLAEAFSLSDVIALCDKKPVPAQIYDDVIDLRQQVQQHSVASSLLEYGMSEVSLLAFDPQYNLHVKCRFDFLSFDNAGIDIKTGNNITPRGFKKAIRDFRYCIQQAYYLRVAQLLNIDIVVFSFIAVSTSDMKDVVVYEIDDMSMDKAHFDMHQALASLANAIETDQWPGYGNDNVITLNVW